MFDFLKKKLKKTIEKVSDKIGWGKEKDEEETPKEFKEDIKKIKEALEERSHERDVTEVPKAVDEPEEKEETPEEEGPEPETQEEILEEIKEEVLEEEPEEEPKPEIVDIEPEEEEAPEEEVEEEPAEEREEELIEEITKEPEEETPEEKEEEELIEEITKEPEEETPEGREEEIIEEIEGIQEEMEEESPEGREEEIDDIQKSRERDVTSIPEAAGEEKEEPEGETPEPEPVEEKTIGEVIEEEQKEAEEEPKPSEQDAAEAPKKKRGFFDRIKEVFAEKKLGEREFKAIFEDIEMVLLENNVALEVIELLEGNMRKEIVGESVTRGRVEKIIKKSIKDTVEQVLMEPDIDTFLDKVRAARPCSIMFVGVNGVGKTTVLAKIAKWFMDNEMSVVIAASDTFRAASIEQIQEHADRLRIKMIKHDYGSDAAAVAYDAIEHAKSKDIDVVLIDTAGRQHANVNLMDELKKIERVNKPTFKIFCADSLTGNDAVEQARQFNEAVNFDYSILNKADIDRKGGAILSVSYITKKPILFIGTGQEYNDLKVFSKKDTMEKLLKF